MQISNRAIPQTGVIIAVLGPTNTGKTYHAMERMAAFNTGMIGFPLRLLARENYDRLVKTKGADAVALVTGEEKIIPPSARYYCCTVESMPVDQVFDFVAVDEIQLCADPDRGHVFTDRLLRARGRSETMFMGAETIRPLLASLVPGVEFVSRPRLSALTYKGFKKMTRLPPRSAIVAFSVDDVYAIAELIRRQRGGTAVVLGALSPRTRNKQVEMYQNGEVDFLVATDAVGMGLNMDIHHVALAATRKFDGHAVRSLSAAEIAQIAGRAGRHMRDGTFGVTGDLTGLDDDMVEAIENHRFESLPALCWRNSILDFRTPKALLDSLDRHSGTAALMRGRPSDDYTALMHLMRRDDIMARAGSDMAVRTLWDVCQIPDFRQTLNENHQELLAGVYISVMDKGVLDPAWVRTQIDRLDRTEGDVDTLMTRIAHVRTWTYITHKSEWLKNAGEWQDKARAIEDRLSDALHEGLMKRFVDRRSAVLMRAMEEGSEMLAGVKAGGAVVVEGQEVGHLEGFRFIPDERASGTDYKAVMTAARNALKPEIKRRLSLMLEAQDKQFKINEYGDILYQADASNPLPGQPVARLRRGAGLLSPELDVIDSDLLAGQDRAAVAERLKLWTKVNIATVLEPLLPLMEGDDITGSARGIAFQLFEALGIIEREKIEDLIATLDDEGRAALRARKVRLGPVLVFLPALNKPAAVRLRALLWSLWHNRALPAPVPADGITSFSIAGREGDADFLRAVGYPVYGPRSIRVDMLDRLICAIYDNAKDGKFKAEHKMAEWLGCPIADLYGVIEAMGHRKMDEPAPAEVTVEQLAEAAAEAPPALEAAKPAVAEKPLLATFLLKRGKAYGTRAPRPERAPRPDLAVRKHAVPTEDKAPRRAERPKDRKKKDDREDRVISAKPQTNADDNPFAILQSLKGKK